MERDLVEMVIADLQEHSDGIDLFSKDYFFNPKHAEHRSRVAMLGGPIGHRSRFSILLREGMTKDRRMKIFAGTYDLGNMRTLPKAACTYTELANHLYPKVRSHNVANDSFETIQNGIEEITGRKMRDHFETNRSTTAKVIHTLHLLKRRQAHLFQLLSRPEPSSRSFSMSFRDAYPYKKNRDQVWFIADLKAYLSAELSDKQIEKIGSRHQELQQWMDIVVQGVEQKLFAAYSRDYASMVSAYTAMARALENFQIKSEVNRAPLDEVLFSYVYSLEEANFYAGYPEMFRVAVPQISVTPIWKELRKLAQTLFPEESKEPREAIELIRVKDAPAFANRNREEIAALLQLALGKYCDVRKFDQIVKEGCNLMRTDCFFGRNGKRPMQDDTTLVSILYIVAAFGCVAYSLFDSTNFKAYWHSQHGQGGSINTSNKVVLSGDVDPTIDEVPEEHRHIWACRLEWFINAFRGHHQLIEQKFEFRSAMAMIVMKTFNLNTPDCIARIRRDLIEYLGEQLPATT